MAMKINSSNISCPCCQGSLTPTALHCDACDVTVTGRFAANEFASLADDDLHLLRIFVRCEGHIREMESALGVSYPTIKARLATLKKTLAFKTEILPEAVSPSAVVLRELEAGTISFDAAMQKLKLLQKEKQP